MDPSAIIGLIQNLYTIGVYLDDLKNSWKERKQWKSYTEGLIRLLRELQEHQKNAENARGSEDERWYKNFLEAVRKKSPHEDFDGFLDQFQQKVEELIEELKTERKTTPERVESRRKRFWAHLAHPLKRAEVSQTFNDIRQLYSILSEVRNSDEFNLNLDTHKKVNEGFQNITKKVDEGFKVIELRDQREKGEKIIKWLSPLEFLRKQHELYSNCFQTGQWLLDSVEFTEWTKGGSWPLYYIGSPGAGKTVLTSIIINHLQELCKVQASTTQKRSAVLFLYLDHAETKIQTFENIMGSILKQLVQNQDAQQPLPQPVIQLYEGCKGEIRPSINDYLNILRPLIRDSYDRVYLVVDALDEFPEGNRDTLRQKLDDIVPDKVSVLMTSREIMDTYEELAITCNGCGAGKEGTKLVLYYRCQDCKPNRDFCQECKDQGATCGVASHTLGVTKAVIRKIMTPDEEIERFVARDLESMVTQDNSGRGDDRTGGVNITRSRLADVCARDPQLRIDIPIKIKDQAKGMFLLAKLHLDSLKRLGTPKKVRNALNHISDLDDVSKVYEDMFTRIKSPEYREDRALALKTLSWVVGAQRSLTAEELLHALEITPSKSEINDRDLEKWELLQRITFGLIVKGAGIEDVDRGDKQHAVVSFVHRTAQEFFSKQLVTGSLGEDILTDMLTYLNFPSLAEPCGGDREDEKIRERLKSLPFAAYACQYWGDHARNVQSTPEIQEKITTFLRNPTRLASIVQLAWYVGSKSRTSTSWDVREDLSSLHFCAWHALDFAIPRLVDGEPHLDIDQLDGIGRTPLMYACRRGHCETVKLLLELHADPDIECYQGSGAIVEAVISNHAEIVKILLATKSVDVNKTYSRHGERTVLMLAALEGNEETVSHILQGNDVNVNLADEKGYSALCLAVTTESIAVVDLLLHQQGINVDSINCNGASALIIAAEHGSEAMVRILLQHGANLLLKDCEDGTAISRAMERGHYSTVNEMLKSQIDFAGKDNQGHSLLHSASLSKETQPDIIRQLINGGVSVDTLDDHGKTSLHVACRVGNLEVVEVLLAEGASPEIKDKFDRTPFEVAWHHGNTNVVKTLSGKMGRPAPDDTSLPLWALAKLGHEDLVRTKLQTTGYNLGEIDPDDGRTALHWAIESVKPDATSNILTLLLDAGFSPSNTDNEKMTPLHLLAYIDSAELDNVACIQALLRKHAPLEVRDRYDRTPLMAAQYSAAKYSKDYELAVAFLESGSSAAGCVREQLQATFFTAIMLGKVKAVQQLVNAGANLNARDEDDKTAFALAEEHHKQDVLEVLRKASRGKKSDDRHT